MAAKHETIVIETLEELERLARSWRSGIDLDTLLSLEFMPQSARRSQYERHLTGLYTECGCLAGFVAASSLTIGYLLASYQLGWIEIPVKPWVEISAVIGVFMTGVFAGKLGMLFLTWRRLIAFSQSIALNRERLLTPEKA